jgi:hypothetical protein
MVNRVPNSKDRTEGEVGYANNYGPTANKKQFQWPEKSLCQGNEDWFDEKYTPIKNKRYSDLWKEYDE